jgi:hypothetical protein
MSIDQYDDRKWLFTSNANDIRGNLASKVFFNVSTFKGSQAEEFMKVANYSNKPIGSKDNDVHPEVVAFIVDAAEYAKSMNGKSLDQVSSFLNNVCRRWNDLNDDARSFYNTYVAIINNGSSVSDFSEASNNPSAYKIIIKNSSSKTPILAEQLVKIDTSVVDRILIGKDIKDAIQHAQVSADTLQKIFTEVYNGTTSTGTTGTTPIVPDLKKAKASSSNRFNIRIDDLVRKRFFAISHAEVSAEPSEEGPEKYATLNMSSANVISRDSNGNFYKEVNGRKVPIGRDDQETINVLKANNYCFGTYVNGSTDDCNKFIFEALLSQDADALDKVLTEMKQKQNFFKVATDDIKNLHPVLALRILQQFGFHKYQVYDDSAGMSLWKVESVSHWLKNYMADRFTTLELQQMITANDQHYILSYLELVSQYVNSNPAILNKNYSGSSEEALGKLKKSEYAERLGLDWDIKLKSSVFSDSITRLRSHLASRSKFSPFLVVSNRVATPFGRTLAPGMTLLTGGGATCDLAIKKLNSAGQLSGSQMIKVYLDSVLRELSNRNKTLSVNDRKNIESTFNKYRELESELLRTLCYVDEFNSLSDKFQDYKSEVLSTENLQKFVNRLQGLSNKTQSTEGHILDIISKIQNLIGENPSGLTNISAADAW